ncbi:MAG: hypothetical protein Q4D79_15545 [Propionibacteriaceae bacterium]|nr:hypothetical protein [Propionibacteriaceae bacterium]
MKRDFVTHLIKAHLHLRDAALTLVPEPHRQRLRRIDREWRALIVECLSAENPAPTKRGSRRINIEE